MSLPQSRVAVYVVLLLSFLMYSLAWATFSSSIAVLAGVFSLGPIEIGALASAVSIGYLTTLPGGILSDRFGKSRILSIGLAICSVGLAAIGMSNSFICCFVSALVLGVGSGFTEAAINPLILGLFPGRRAFALGGEYACWGVGGFLGPLLVGYTYSKYVDWRLDFFLTSVIVVVALVVCLATRPGAREINSNGRPRDFALIDLSPLARLMLANLLAFGVQGCIAAWLILFLTIERGLGLPLATTSLSVYFLFYAGGRPFWGLFADKEGYARTVKICAVLGGILLFLTISTQPGVLPVVLMASTGFFTGGLIPNITTAACSRLKSAPGAASGAVNVSGGIGSILLPFTFGVVVLFSSAYWGFVLISSLAIILALIVN